MAEDGRVQVLGYWHDQACLVARYLEYAETAARVNDDFPWCTCRRGRRTEDTPGNKQ